MDSQGNLYGTTFLEGAYGYGNVLKLTPSEGSWTYSSLHDFTGTDGACPTGNLVLDSIGNIYGTTELGGDLSICGGEGCGVIFQITQ